MCQYLQYYLLLLKDFGQKHVEKHKFIILFCKLPQQMSAFETAVPPQKKTHRSYSSAMTCLKPQDVGRITFGFIKP